MCRGAGLLCTAAMRRCAVFGTDSGAHTPVQPPTKRFITGDTLVVDGAAWIYRPQLVPREMVTQLSRGIEAKSRKVGTAAAATRSKL